MIHPLLSNLRSQKIAELLSVFPTLHAAEGGQFISLWNYLESRLQRFYSANTFRIFLDELVKSDRKQRVVLSQVLGKHSAQINNAYRHANKICGLDWHDEQVRSESDYERFILIDQDVHPAYLRLVEAVFRPLLQVVAHFSRLNRGKSVEGLDLYNIVQELKLTSFGELLSPYNHLMRNSIAHGGITYSGDGVIYEDSKARRKNSTVGVLFANSTTYWMFATVSCWPSQYSFELGKTAVISYRSNF